MLILILKLGLNVYNIYCEFFSLLEKLNILSINEIKQIKKNILENYFKGDNNIYNLSKCIELALKQLNFNDTISDTTDNLRIFYNKWHALIYYRIKYPNQTSINLDEYFNLFNKKSKILKNKIKDLKGNNKKFLIEELLENPNIITKKNIKLNLIRSEMKNNNFIVNKIISEGYTKDFISWKENDNVFSKSILYAFID